MTRGTDSRPVVQAEDIDRLARELGEVAVAEAERIRRIGLKKRAYSVPVGKPDLSERFDAWIRSAIADEVIPAVPVVAAQGDGDEGILEDEFDREICRKALTSLKASGLRAAARSLGLPTSGRIDELVDRIGRSVRWSEEEVARLVLRYEREPDPERSIVERLVPLEEAPDLDHVKRRLSYVAGRYVRVGVARWFIFQQVSSTDDAAVATGELRAFTATVTDHSESPQLVPSERPRHQVQIRLDGSSVMRIQRAPLMDAAGAIAAARGTLDVVPFGYVAARVPAGSKIDVSLSMQTIFMLELMSSRMEAEGLRRRNLVSARFRMDDSADDDDNDRRPNLRAVRFEGKYLLDSREACRLIADGRALVDFTLVLSSDHRSDGETAEFPVRVAIERDHVLVMTGLSTMPAVARDIHSAVTNAVQAALIDGISDEEQLAQLLRRIVARASSTAPIEVADLLNDPVD